MKLELVYCPSTYNIGTVCLILIGNNVVVVVGVGGNFTIIVSMYVWRFLFRLCQPIVTDMENRMRLLGACSLCTWRRKILHREILRQSNFSLLYDDFSLDYFSPDNFSLGKFLTEDFLKKLFANQTNTFHIIHI
jgi:hypothetical protein